MFIDKQDSVDVIHLERSLGKCHPKSRRTGHRAYGWRTANMIHAVMSIGVNKDHIKTG